LCRTQWLAIDSVRYFFIDGRHFDNWAELGKVFDNLHVGIILNQIDGKTASGVDLATVPTVSGTNFQRV